MRQLFLFVISSFTLLAAASWLAPVSADAAPENGPRPRITETSYEKGEHPQRVALLPLLERGNGRLSPRLKEALTERLSAEVRLPLNDTMHWISYVSEEESETAFDKILQDRGKRASLAEVLKDVSQACGADLTLLLEVRSLYERRFFKWNGEMGLESVAALTLWGYDARRDRLIEEPVSRFAHDDYHPSREAAVLLQEALEEALRRAGIHEQLMAEVRKPRITPHINTP